MIEEEETLSWDDDLVCPKCGEDWEKIEETWSRNEHCKCGEFLDNPVCLIKKEDFKEQENGCAD